MKIKFHYTVYLFPVVTHPNNLFEDYKSNSSKQPKVPQTLVIWFEKYGYYMHQVYYDNLHMITA